MFLVRKFYSNSVKIYGAILVFLTISTQASADNVAIIGGIDLTVVLPTQLLSLLQAISPRLLWGM
jgi:hypothetical protein